MGDVLEVGDGAAGVVGRGGGEDTVPTKVDPRSRISWEVAMAVGGGREEVTKLSRLDAIARKRVSCAHRRLEVAARCYV